MLCYKDTTFCSSDTTMHTCGRELTEEKRKSAERLGLPVAYGKFCEDAEIPAEKD